MCYIARVRNILYVITLCLLVSCSSKNYNQVNRLLQDQIKQDLIGYQALHKLKSSITEDTVFTQGRVLLSRQTDSLYPFEFLIIDSNQNFVSYVNDTVYSYHSSFQKQYYNLAQENGLDMISNGYKFNLLLPEIVSRNNDLGYLRWKRNKSNGEVVFSGWNKDVSTEIHFNSQGNLNKVNYTFFSEGYFYYDEHRFDSYTSDFQREELFLRKAERELYVPSSQDLEVSPNPTFTFPAFKNLEGESVDISTDNIVILDFFFNGCPPCVASIPKLNELYQNVGNKIPMYGINAIDKSADHISEFQKKYGVKYPLLMGEKSFNQKLGIRSYPELLVIQNGEIIYRHIGTLYTLDDIEGFLKELVDN